MYHALVVIFLEFFAWGLLTSPIIAVSIAFFFIVFILNTVSMLLNLMQVQDLNHYLTHLNGISTAQGLVTDIHPLKYGLAEITLETSLGFFSLLLWIELIDRRPPF